MRLSRLVRRPPSGAVRFLLASLVCLALFVAASAQVAARGPLTRVDESLAQTAYRFAKDNPPAYDFALWVTDLGGGNVRAAVVVTAVLLLLLDGQWRVAILLGLSQWWFPDLVGKAKLYFERPRPEFPEVPTLSGGYAYPSGHAAGVTATYGMLIILCWWNWSDRRVRLLATSFFGTLIFCVGLSRMLLGVHWFSDVIGGYLMALGYTALVSGGMLLLWRDGARLRKIQDLPPVRGQGRP